MPPPINQSERDYSVRHGVYVRCFNQPEHGYSVRHGAHVTGCTYDFRPISARHSRTLISAAPCGGLRNLAQPHAATVCTSRGVRTQFDQSGHDYGVRHGVYVRCFNQSEHGYSERHGVYVTGCT